MTQATKLLIALFCVIKLTLHFIADSHSGFQGDELLHIETGKHLAWGYMEFPPLIGWLAFLQNQIGINTIYVHHLFAHLASILILIYVAKTTIALGGQNRAVFLVLLCILIAPGFGRSQQLFQPVVFSQLFWVLSFYQLVRFVKTLENKYLWYLTCTVILGFLVKYDALFLIAGLTGLFLMPRTRQALLQQRFWLNGIVALVCVLPNLIWQYNHELPVLQMFNRLAETQLNDHSRVGNFIRLLIEINPINSLLLLFPGIYYLLKYNQKIHQPLAITILLSVALLSFKQGKAYYFYPIVLTLLPFGAIFWEQLVLQKRKWMMYPVLASLCLGGLIIPFGMPVYSFPHYLKSIYPYEKKQIKGGTYAINFDEYYTTPKWNETMQQLKTVYDSLPAAEQRNCLIWGKNNAQAGAVNLFRQPYHLPQSFSYHGSFYTWAPSGEMPGTIIGLSYQVGRFFEAYFEEVTLVRTIYNPYANTEEELVQRIFVCKKPKQDFNQLRFLFTKRIFE